jgi:hypothetical protein
MIPISCWEMFKQRKLDFNTIVPIVLTILVFSVSYYLNYLQ